MALHDNLAMLYWSASSHVQEAKRLHLALDESDIRDLIHAAKVLNASPWPRMRYVAGKSLPVVVVRV